MKRCMEISAGFDYIMEEVVHQMNTWVFTESNPFYPVPVIYDRAHCEKVIRRIINEA